MKESLETRVLAFVRSTVAILGPFILIAPLLYVAWFLVTDASPEYTTLVMKNYRIFFCMPYAAFFAYYLVVTLEKASGDIKVKFFGFEFEGAAGPLLFWLLIFLAILFGFDRFWVQAWE